MVQWHTLRTSAAGLFPTLISLVQPTLHPRLLDLYQTFVSDESAMVRRSAALFLKVRGAKGKMDRLMNE